MIPTLLTATSVFIIAFIAAPPVDIDGIREPVSGSLLYGNNISAPRRSLTGSKRNGTSITVSAAPDLGWRVTLTPETAPTESSMSGKHYGGTASSSLPGCKQTNLWTRLYCLMQAVMESPAAQSLCAVSFQPAVGCDSRGDPSATSMMCAALDSGVSKSTMSGLNGMNGSPKGSTPILKSLSLTPSFMEGLCFGIGFRRSKRTLGSPLHLTRRTLLCLANNRGDGGPVVPEELSSARLRTTGDKPPERGPGKHDESKRDAPAKGDPSLSPEAEAIINRWKLREGAYKGVEIPSRFVKVIYRGKYNKNSVFDNLYPLVLSPAMIDIAYGKVKSNPGMMTPGTTPETLSGWGKEHVDSLISKLADESFQFSRARLVEIPKPQGGVRGIKVASPRDKVVQRVIADILEAIYEPAFSKCSFGFRPLLGCHDTLRYVVKHYQSSRWFIEGDISKCFDEIDHNILVGIMRRRIKDEKFIRLIWKALRAGFLDSSKVPQDCLLGTPQGSIVSPILCNIIMNEFDTYIEETLKPQYTRGTSRRQPPAYKSLMAGANLFDKKYQRTKDPADLKGAQIRRAKAQLMPSMDPVDPNFRRLLYVRYADDWLIGFAGPYCEAVEIRELCRDFLSSIKLRLSIEKTLITKGVSGCTFLGARVHVPLNEQRFRKAKRLSRATLGVRLNAPLDRVIRKLATAGYCTKTGIPTPRMSLYAASKEEIVVNYGAVIRGLLNYYSFADNYPRLASSVFYILRNSACKVLAAKLKLKTVRQVLLKFGFYLNKDGGSPLPNFKSAKVRGELFKRNPSTRIPLYRKALLTIRLESMECAVCGSTYKVEMHHVRALKDLNKRLDPVSRAMAARNRKQIPLCRVHHMAQHVNLNMVRSAALKENRRLGLSSAGLS